MSMYGELKVCDTVDKRLFVMGTYNIMSIQKRIIVVLGMHRSGTSAVTCGLTALGVDLGDTLMPPIEGVNAKGFFEDIDIYAFNVEILEFISSDWHCLAPIEPHDIETLNQKGYFLRAVDLLRRKTAGTQLFGFKDPRLAKLLPFWKPVFTHCGFDINYVLIIRNPLSVAQSLANRDGFSHEKSYMLWMGHVLTSLEHTETYLRALVDYDRLMEEPQKNIEFIAKYLGLTVDAQALQRYQSEFIDDKLRHTIYDKNDLVLDRACPPLVHELYVALLDVVADNRQQIDLPAFHDRTKIWINEFERLKSGLRLADQLTEQIDRLRQSIAVRDSEITGIITSAISQDENIFRHEFDPVWYVKKYADIDPSLVDPYQHYISYGILEGRIPSNNLIGFTRDGLLNALKNIQDQRDQTMTLAKDQLQQITEQKKENLERTDMFNQELQRLQAEYAERELTHTTTLDSLQNELASQLRNQVQREQGMAAQIMSLQHQANADKEALSQQYEARIQTLNDQKAENEWLTAERIHTLNQELQRLQAEYAERELTHTTTLDSLQQQSAAEKVHLEVEYQTCLQTLQHQQVEREQSSDECIKVWIQMVAERDRELEENQQILERMRCELTGMRNALLQSPFAAPNKFGEISPIHGEKVVATLEELLGCHDEQFIHISYHTLLGRSPDLDGLRYYLGRLRNGISKVEILSQLRFSKEGSVRQHCVEGLEQEIARHRRQHRSLHASVARFFGLQFGKSMQDLRAVENQYHRLDAQGRQFVAKIEKNLYRLTVSIQNSICEPEKKQIAATAGTQVIQTVTTTPALENGVVKVTVAILTKNPGDVFKKVLSTVLGQETPWTYEVLVVDSGSSDGTIEFIKRYPRVHLLQIKSNEFGHGRTRNFAVSMAQGQYIAMLTHDAMPASTSWLENLVKPLDEDPSVAGVFGRHKAYEEHSTYTKRDTELHFNGFLQWPRIMGIEDPERYKHEQGYRQVLHFFSDNNACLRKEVWVKIPYPDVNFAEDQLWAKAVIEAGYKRAYADDAVVYHSHDYSIKDTFRRSFDESRALKTLFGYDLCPTAKHGLMQIQACTKADLKFLKSAGLNNSFGLSVKTPFLHMAKQTGWYIGRYRGRFDGVIFLLFSLDDAKKRRSNLTMFKKLKTLFGSSMHKPSRAVICDIDVPRQDSVQEAVQQSAMLSKINVIGFYDFVLTEDAGVLPADSCTVDGASINWLIPDFGIGSGGHLNIFRFISMLESKGYKNTICLVGNHRHESPADARRMICEHFFDLRADVVFGIESLPAARYSFATSWITAYALRGFGLTCHKLYFVQDFEPAFYAHGSEYAFAEETYKFGFTGVCAGDWLVRILKADYGMQCHSVSFSYDRDLYVQTRRREPEKLRVFCYVRPPTIRRGLESALLALSLVGDERPDVEFIFAGWDMGSYHFPYSHLNGGCLSLKELPDLYSQCDVALVFSFTNLSLLPLELMACGCVVVSNRAPNTEWLLNDENSILPKSAAPRSIANAIIDILGDAPRRNALVQRAKTFAQSTDWLAEGEKFSSILRLLQNPVSDRN